MLNLRQQIQLAEKKKIAIGHFNISDLAALKGIVRAAVETGQPIIIGTSEGEREFLGATEINGFIRELRAEYKIPIFTNADHTHSIERVKEAIRAGYDAILVDYSKLSLEQNIKKTKAAVEYIKAANKDILVEGEIGYIGSGSTILAEIPKDAQINFEQLPKVEDVERFAKETKIDLVAPAVGNIHGILADAPMPNLDIKRIKEIKNKIKIPIILHGGSGLKTEDFQDAIRAGVSAIHINTELRLAWRRNVEESLKQNPSEIVPYKILSKAVDGIYNLVKEKIRIFSFSNIS